MWSPTRSSTTPFKLSVDAEPTLHSELLHLTHQEADDPGILGERRSPELQQHLTADLGLALVEHDAVPPERGQHAASTPATPAPIGTTRFTA